MIDPVTGVEIQGTPAPAIPPPAKPGDASGTPPAQGAKQVPITALHEERDKRQAAEQQSATLLAEIENLKGILAQQQQQPPIQPPAQPFQPAVPQEDMRAKLDKMWEDDPRQAFQTEMMIAFQWRDWVDTNVEYQFDATRSKYVDFKDYEPSVRKYIRALPMEERAKPNIAEAAYYMVRGQKVDDIIKSREQMLLEKIRKGESIQGFTAGTYGTPPPASGPTVTEQEKAVASAMGMTVEDYLKWKK
jgi:hypothetical protein